MKIPVLVQVCNTETGEVFTLFAKSGSDAVTRLITSKVDLSEENITATELTVVMEDGCHCNIHMLRDIPAGSFFRTVNYRTFHVGRTVLLKERDSYDRSSKKYCCIHAEDICRSRMLKPTQWVITDFTY